MIKSLFTIEAELCVLTDAELVRSFPVGGSFQLRMKSSYFSWLRRKIESTGCPSWRDALDNDKEGTMLPSDFDLGHEGLRQSLRWAAAHSLYCVQLPNATRMLRAGTVTIAVLASGKIIPNHTVKEDIEVEKASWRERSLAWSRSAEIQRYLRELKWYSADCFTFKMKNSFGIVHKSLAKVAED